MEIKFALYEEMEKTIKKFFSLRASAKCKICRVSKRNIYQENNSFVIWKSNGETVKSDILTVTIDPETIDTFNRAIYSVKIGA